MKTFALTAAALAVALGSATAPALAGGSNDSLHDFDTSIVSLDRAAGTIKLSSGQTLDQSLEYFAFPTAAAAGDKVRVSIDDDNRTLKGVRVIR